MELFKLTAKQIKKLEKIIDDNRQRYLEMPDASHFQAGARVNVLQGDGQKIADISIAEAFKL